MRAVEDMMSDSSWCLPYYYHHNNQSNSKEYMSQDQLLLLSIRDFEISQESVMVFED